MAELGAAAESCQNLALVGGGCRWMVRIVISMLLLNLVCVQGVGSAHDL